MDIRERFTDRADAGGRLAARVVQLGLTRPVVLALPRGGLPVGEPVAAGLESPLEVFVARKIPAPGHPEVAVGAVAEGGEPWLSAELLRRVGARPEEVEPAVARERAELDRRVREYRGDRALPALPGADVVVVDDGLATGATARAALVALRARHPRRLVLAVPVLPKEAMANLRELADDVVAVLTPSPMRAVSLWYDRFGQLTDDDVRAVLERHPGGAT